MFSSLLLQAYVSKVEADDMPLLEQRLAESNARLCFLVDYVTLSPADITLNRVTAQWHMRMPAVFQDHQQMVAEKTEQYQAGLKVSAGALFMCFLRLSVCLLICPSVIYLSVCLFVCLSICHPSACLSVHLSERSCSRSLTLTSSLSFL